MKKAMITLSFALAAVIAFAGGDEKKATRSYKVDTQESAITWKGKKVSGEHYGKLLFANGTFQVVDNAITGGNVATDMTSITVEDLTGDYKGKLEGHLRSADFFDVENHNQAVLKINEVKANKGGYELVGELTIKGITHPVTVPAKAKVNEKTLALRGEFTFDRTKYNIKYGSGKFFEGLGDKMIYDDVELSFVVIATPE